MSPRRLVQCEFGTVEELLRPAPRKPFDRNKVPRLDVNRRRHIEGRLVTIRGKASTPTLNAVCKALGLRRSAAKYWFPEICRSIVVKRRELEMKQRERHLLEGTELVKQAVAEILSSGAALSRRRVESKLKTHRRSLLEPQLRDAYRAAIRLLDPLAGLRARDLEVSGEPDSETPLPCF